MDPTPPQSLAVLVLLPFVAAAFLGARTAARRVTLDPTLARLLPPSLAVAAWALAVHSVGLVAHSFTWGLWLGTSWVGIAGAWLAWSDRGGHEHSPRLPLVLWVVAIAATLWFAPAAFRFSFHDELLQVGHQSIAAQIQNGIYPPRHGTFPVYLLRYHYGFDLLAAMLSSLTRLSIERSIDVLTVAAWFYALCLAWIGGERLAGAGRGWIVPLALFFAGPVPWFFAPLREPVGLQRWLGLVKVGPALLNPSLASYFFQHPWSAGIPLALAILGLALDRRPGRTAWRAGALIVLFLFLSLCQIVLFIALLPGLALVLGALAWRRAPWQAAAWVTGAAATLAVASRLGGFFAAVPDLEPGVQFSLWSQTHHAGTNALWTLASFGATLPLGIVGLVLLLRRDVAWGLVLTGVSAGGILVLNLFRYANSWDIVKFGTAALLALGIAAGTAIARLWGAAPRRLCKPMALVLLALAALPGVGFLGCFAVSPLRSQIPSLYYYQTPRPDPEHLAAIAWLRKQVGAGDLVFCPPELAPSYAQLGGLPQMQLDPTTVNFGFPPKLLQRRRAFTERLADPGVYRAEGVRWLVVPDRHPFFDAARVEGWRERGSIVPVQRFGLITIYEISPSTMPSGTNRSPQSSGER
ncbi:MAG TPA: hypothetical protein VFE28_09725 [Candidatus Krumholzibacteria bacterium]|nr:hypothetical protein [Candidatus Krumholzibacteria bacterium]